MGFSATRDDGACIFVPQYLSTCAHEGRQHHCFGIPVNVAGFFLCYDMLKMHILGSLTSHELRFSPCALELRTQSLAKVFQFFFSHEHFLTGRKNFVTEYCCLAHAYLQVSRDAI